MKEISLTAARQWRGTGGLWSPVSISLTCPNCGERGVFDCIDSKSEPGWELVTSQMRCPGCSKRVTLCAIGCKGSTAEYTMDPATYKPIGILAVHPHVDDRREPIPGSDNAPERVQRAYQDALDTFNLGV